MHKFICGMTASGKSSLAKMFSKEYKRRKVLVGVLDPLLDDGWSCDFMTDNPTEFLEWAKKHKQAILFIDEGGQSIGRYDTEMQWCATQARHWGHTSYFISQGLTQVAPIVREQCDKFYIFACGERNTLLIAEECREKSLKNIGKLPALYFCEVSRFSPIKWGRVDHGKGTCYYIDEPPTSEVTDETETDDNRDDDGNDDGLRGVGETRPGDESNAKSDGRTDDSISGAGGS